MGPLKSLKSRLLVWVFLPTLVISVLDSITTYRDTAATATLVQQQLLKGSARIIAEQLNVVDGGYELSVPPAALELFATKYKDLVFYSVRSMQGSLIAGTDELKPYDHALAIDEEQFYLTTLRDEPMRVIAYAHALPNSPDIYAVTQVAQTLNGYEAFKQDLFWLTMRDHLTLLAIVVLGLVIAFRWTLKPVRSFGQQLAQRQAGSLERLDEASAPKELTPVIHALNDYVVRLDRTLNDYEQFVANTAHHLRTSFAILTSQINFGMRSGQLSPEQRQLLASIQKTVGQGTKLINQLLVLAAVEKSLQQGAARAPSQGGVHLAEVATAVLESLAPLAQQQQVELGVGTLDPALQVAMPPYLMRELVSNLVDNAIAHMGGPGQVTVSVTRQGNTAQLSVVDTGPGIAPELRAKVLERFYRLDESKPNSSGLGLAIVKEICDAFGASLQLRTPPSGRGLQVDLGFALATPSATSPAGMP